MRAVRHASPWLCHQAADVVGQQYTAMIEDPRGHIDYDEQGTGPSIFFVPGSWSTRSAWRGVITLLADRCCIVTTNLLGYGNTEERRTADNASIDLEAEIVEAVIRHAGRAIHLVGHSYGSVVCLAVALRGAAQLASLTVIEPTNFNLLRRCGGIELYEQVRAVSDAYADTYRNGEREAARRLIDFYGGSGSYDAFPQRMRDSIIATTAVNILDLISVWGFDQELAAYANITVPSLVIRGSAGRRDTKSCDIKLGARDRPERQPFRYCDPCVGSREAHRGARIEGGDRELDDAPAIPASHQPPLPPPRRGG